MKKLLFLLIGGLVLLILLSFLWPLAQAQLANGAFGALFSDRAQETPARVEIVTADGKTAVFRQGTALYAKLIQMLRDARSQGAFQQNGPSPELEEPKARYGELIIYRFGILSHLKIYRSAKNRNYFWIGVPHADGSGTYLPLFAFGSGLDELVDSASSANPAASVGR